MLRSDVLIQSQSEWASLVVLIPKLDGILRFCVDFRLLRTMTVRVANLISEMVSCLDCFRDATVFITLDCISGYWQIPVAAEDTSKTNFTWHVRMFSFRRMLFGLMSAPTTFPRLLDILLAGYQ